MSKNKEGKHAFYLYVNDSMPLPQSAVEAKPVAWMGKYPFLGNVVINLFKYKQDAMDKSEETGGNITALYPVEALAELDEENFELKAGMALHEKALNDKDKEIEELKEQIETINGMIGESESGETITTSGNIPATKSKLDEAVSKTLEILSECNMGLLGGVSNDVFPDSVRIYTKKIENLIGFLESLPEQKPEGGDTLPIQLDSCDDIQDNFKPKEGE